MIRQTNIYIGDGGRQWRMQLNEESLSSGTDMGNADTETRYLIRHQ